MNNLAAQDTARVAHMAAQYDRWAERANVIPWSDLLEHRRNRAP